MGDYKGTTVSETPHKMTLKEKLRKRWWLHLINFVVGTIVITMLLNYVMLPAIAQHDVNKAELFMEEQIVTNPRPDFVHLKIRNKVINHSLFTPTLFPFNASLFLEDTEPNIKPFGYITIPAVHATKVSFTDIEQELAIVDMEQFIAYNKLVTTAENFRLAVRGRTKLRLGALPKPWVNFNKAIYMKGLNGLKGLRVTDVNLTVGSFPDGSNMHGNVIIPNPSIMTLQIGDMIQDLFVDGKPIGNTTIKGVTLKPGDNMFPVTSVTNQIAIIPLVGPGNKYPNGVLDIEARTRNITYNGVQVPYFTEAMRQAPVTFKMDIAGPLRKIGLGSLIDGVKSSPASASSSAAPSLSAAAPAGNA